jgi:hypothetical protein
MYGIFEITQGNIPADGLRISGIGNEFSMHSHPNYIAYTLIPNILVSGISSLCSGLLVTFWVLFFLHKKYGSIFMVVLSFWQFITGGGMAIDVAILSAIIATQVNGNLLWWRKITTQKLRYALSLLWPWVFVLFSTLSVAILFLTVVGRNSEAIQELVVVLAACLFLPLILSILGGFSRDAAGYISVGPGEWILKKTSQRITDS